MAFLKKPFRDPRKHTSSEARDTRRAAYRNKLTVLAKPKGLAILFFASWLASLYVQNIFFNALILGYQNTRARLHGESTETAMILRSFYEPILFQYPSWLLFGVILFCFTSAYLCLRVRNAFRALEDIQNASANEWESTANLLKQYRIIWADPSVPFDGVGGVPVAHIRPSVLKQFGMERLPFFDDQYQKEHDIPDIKAAIVAQGEDMDTMLKSAEILRKELPENENEYAILIADDNTNVIALGITRSGKGVFFVNANIDTFSRPRRMEDKASFFIADTKGIALRENYKMLEDRGYEVLVFNTADPFFSNPFSPLFTATHNYEDYLFKEGLELVDRYKRLDFAVQDIASLASILYIRPKTGDRFFVDNARALFRASCLAIIDYCLQTKQKHKICLYTISKTISNMMGLKMNRKTHPYLRKYITEERSIDDLYADYKGKSALDVYFGELENEHPAKDAYGSIRMAGGAEQTISGIASEVIIALDPYVRSGNARLTADNAFDFRKLGFGDKPQAIFLIFPDSDSSNEELATLFLEQSFRELVREADATEEGECPRTVIYLLDEFGNLMKIPTIGKKMSAALSRNIRFHLVLQNLGQLNIYDEAERETIYSNSGLTMYIKSNDKNTNKDIMGRLGKRKIASFTRTGDELSLKKSKTESVKDEDMLAFHELEQLQFGENVVLRLSTVSALDNSTITQKPILNRGSERMIPSFWYLHHKKVAWKDIPINNTHVELSLKNYTLELFPAHLVMEEVAQAAGEELETAKQSFKRAVQAKYKKDGNYYRRCEEVWQHTTIRKSIREGLFTDEEMAKDRENLQQGLKRLVSGTVAEFTQWLEMEDNLASIEFVADILDLYGTRKEA